MSIRAKFICNSKIPCGAVTTVYLHPVYASSDGTRSEENKAFSDATPAGQIQITIRNDKPALECFVQGRAYYVDFNEVPAHQPV